MPYAYNVKVQFRLRDSRREDFITLWEIDQKCFSRGISYTRLELATYMRRPGSCTIVAESMRPTGHSKTKSAPLTTPIVGFITVEAGSRGAGHIITIDVLAENRRTGVGSSLLRSAEERLQTSGCSAVVLETAVDNSGALAFYKRHGYDVVKTIPHYYSNGIDALVLRKELRSPDLAG